MEENKKLDNRVRVDFIISTLNRGGAENKLVAVANGIDREKYSIRVLVLKGGPLTTELTVPFYDYVIPSKYSIAGFLRLLLILWKRKTQIVWVVGNGDAGFFGRIAARFAFVPIVIQSLHATGRTGSKSTIDPLNRFLDKLGFLTTRYVAVAKAHMNYLIRNEGLDRDKISYIYNGVDTNVFYPNQLDISLQRSLNIPANVKVIGIVARFKLEKRHMLFLDAAVELSKTNDSVHFLLVGDGPLEEEIKKRVIDLGLDSRVHFTGGVNYVAPYYSLMTLSVLCSNTVETFPNVVIESMASGVPVVTTDVGSVSEAISNGVTGMLIEQDNYLRLSETIVTMLESHDLRKSLAEEALRKVHKDFTLCTMIERREELFQDLLHKGTKRGLR